MRGKSSLYVIVRKGQSDLQRLAGERNWQLLMIEGAIENLRHVARTVGLGRDEACSTHLTAVKEQLTTAVDLRWLEKKEKLAAGKDPNTGEGNTR